MLHSSQSTQQARQLEPSVLPPKAYMYANQMVVQHRTNVADHLKDTQAIRSRLCGFDASLACDL